MAITQVLLVIASTIPILPTKTAIGEDHCMYYQNLIVRATYLVITLPEPIPRIGLVALVG